MLKLVVHIITTVLYRDIHKMAVLCTASDCTCTEVTNSPVQSRDLVDMPCSDIALWYYDRSYLELLSIPFIMFRHCFHL
jgi:hypothetical protein